MKLSELIDLEVQLLRDEQASTTEASDEIARRDKAIGHRVVEAVGLEGDSMAARLAADRDLRHAVCERWLGLLPAAERDSLPGARIEGGYRTVGWILFVVFFLLGIGTAMAALTGTGTQQINVLVFIVIFFVLQIVLLALYPLLMLVRRLRGGDILPFFQGLVVRLSRVKWLDRMTGRAVSDLPHTLAQLRLRQSIYGSVQHWLLFTLVQRMATGFNFAALLTSVFMVTFRDLPFCWSTTLDIAATDLSRWLSWIALPWSWIEGLDGPSLDAIRYSRFVTGDQPGYVQVPDGIDAVALRRTWWPFLVAGLVTWGLLPRAIAYAVGSFFTARESRRVPLNHMAVQHLFERLFPPTVGWSGPDPESVRGAAPAVPEGAAVAPRKLQPGASYLICWGTLAADAERVADHVRARFQREVKATMEAGLADLAVEEATLKELQRKKARRIVLALPEGQQPTKDVMRFLARLRADLGSDCELVVGLLAAGAGGFADVDRDELDSWRARLLAEADPYLSLQKMGRGS